MATLHMPWNVAATSQMDQYPRLPHSTHFLQEVFDLSRTMTLQAVSNDAFGSATETQLPAASSISEFPDGLKQSDTSVNTTSTMVDPRDENAMNPEDAVSTDSSTDDNQDDKITDPEHALPFTSSEQGSNKILDILARRMQDSVVIKDKPIESSRWIQVPRGYLMDLEVRPAKHFKAKAEIKSHVKKRKREATLPETSQRGWREEVQGFRPEEMVWNGAIGFEHCEPEPPSLTNGIHPIFDRSCFDDTPDAIYDQLIPGLQLATLFLTQPICMQFWITLAMGERRHDPAMSVLNGRPAQRIHSHVELTEERAKTLIDLINKLGTDKLVHFRFKSLLQTVNNSKEDGFAYATSAPICDYKGIDTECHGVNRSLVRSIIRFHADYYIVAKKLSQLKFPDMSQKLRFSFGFAVLIVHELAHSIEGIHFRGRASQWVDFQQSGYYREPYWLDWRESECGRAWEETMFGGHLQPTNGRVDGGHGIAVADWPFGESANKPSPKSHRWWSVSMDYIVWMFQQKTWEQEFDLKDLHVFHIPRDGATSLCINSFTTMAPSEEWRVAKEEAAALHVEPARKKRVKALGDTEEQRREDTEVIATVEGEQEAREVTQSQLLKRQVPKFPNTRRLSSVMPGPLPDEHATDILRREKLIPHIRQPSKDLSTLLTPPIEDATSSQQLELSKEQSTKSKEQQRLNSHQQERTAPSSANEAHFSRVNHHPNTAPKPSQRLRPLNNRKPSGILERYKQNRKIRI